MTPELKAEWVAALRSGNFKQGKKALHTVAGDNGCETHSFCCLGVLAESAVAAGVAEREISEYEFEGGVRQYLYTSVDGNTQGSKYLPLAIEIWAGLEDHSGDPYVTIGSERNRLSGHNDNGRTFEEIAQAIEDQVETDTDTETE